jgi:hypothetical protein
MKKWFRSSTDGAVKDWVLMVALATLLVLLIVFMKDLAMWGMS